MTDILTFIPDLRDYQVAGIDWLYSLGEQNVNGILADEMGLGKTLQIIGFLQLLKNDANNLGPHLIVTPLSVLNGWITEIEKFSQDNFAIYVHYGNRDEREEQFYELGKVFNKLQNKLMKKQKIMIFLFTYEMVIKDIELLVHFNKKHSFQYLIVDEAHRLKNPEGVLYSALLQIKTQRKVLLTGTPLQNNIQELLSLLYFISVGSELDVSEDLFRRLKEFEKNLMRGNIVIRFFISFFA
jgi:SNF2 family DNA or RNA helicase